MGDESSPEQQYSLRWNDFHASILSSFRHLRDEEDFVDVTLACDGCSFSAHKVVLSACSPYFRHLLKANPCQHPIVILRDVQKKDMENLLRFMYNGEVHIGQDHLADFLKTAKMLQVRGLAEVHTETSSQTSLLSHHDQKSTTNNNTSSTLPLTTELQESYKETSSPPVKKIKHDDRDKQSISDNERSPTPNLTPTPSSSVVNDNSSLKESLLGQALEGGPTLIHQFSGHRENSESSLQLQSAGEESNSSDMEICDQKNNIQTKLEPNDYPLNLIDDQLMNANGSNLSDQPRTPTFPGSLLGLQGLLPGPSGMSSSSSVDNFVSRRSLDMMRVRATDPRPCPKCGKIYRSAHTLRTHLEDKHTVCPGYRCVLCGTIAKSRNSLHSHMSRQHRGISTKDLPVLPMPSPFDPELASRLLAKAGVKVSAAELRARASPTGPRRSDIKLEAKSAYSCATSETGSSVCGDNDPEDLSITQRYNITGGGTIDVTPLSPANHNHQNTTAKLNSKINALQALTAKSPISSQMSSNSTGSAILDTYLQFIAENSMNMGLTNEQTAAAVHALKLAQISAFDKMSQQNFLDRLTQPSHHHNSDYKNDSSDYLFRGERDRVDNESHINQINHNDKNDDNGDNILDSSDEEDTIYSDEEADHDREPNPDPNSDQGQNQEQIQAIE